MKQVSPPKMKEVFPPTPLNPYTPTPSFKSEGKLQLSSSIDTV
jgi:hypothetical protein